MPYHLFFSPFLNNTISSSHSLTFILIQIFLIIPLFRPLLVPLIVFFIFIFLSDGIHSFPLSVILSSFPHDTFLASVHPSHPNLNPNSFFGGQCCPPLVFIINPLFPFSFSNYLLVFLTRLIPRVLCFLFILGAAVISFSSFTCSSFSLFP